MKNKSIFFVLLLVVQVTTSSCCISKKSVATSHYSTENLKALTHPKQFYLISLKSMDRLSGQVEFEAGNVCLVIRGLDSRLWAVKDESPWFLAPSPLPDESPWNLFDLSKGNWYASRANTALNKSDPKIPQYQHASAISFLSDSAGTKVLDLKQVYQKIENCFGVVLVGEKRYYVFQNLKRINYDRKATGALISAFSGFYDKSVNEFPHEVLIESNNFKDVEEAARIFAEKTKNSANGTHQ